MKREAEIASVVGGKRVVISAAKIAAALGYLRPLRDTTFPKDPNTPICYNTMAKALFEHPEDFQFPLVSGLLRPPYRVLNQIVCHNLYPKGIWD